MRKALITGITGQDGGYLAELLLQHSYEIHGLVRSQDEVTLARLSDHVTVHSGDLLNPASILDAISTVQPDEIYHLAGYSKTAASREIPEETVIVNGVGTLRILEAVRQRARHSRVFVAATSEMFGVPKRLPQDEDSDVRPLNPYGASKAFGFHLVAVYRRTYNLFACSGILFNHESPRRSSNFVSQKIARAAAAAYLGRQRYVSLGNLDVKRDWGYAADYVEAMRLMLQVDAPCDFVIATGRSHSVREFCQIAFSHVNLDYRHFVRVDDSLKRPQDIPETRGDASRAKRVLKWEPRHSFEDLVAMMVDAQVEQLRGMT